MTSPAEPSPPVPSEAASAPRPPDWRIAFYEAQRACALEAEKEANASIEATRKRADNWGKGALAVGSTALTAVGVGTLTDYAPDGHWIAAALVIAGFGLSLGFLLVVGTRLTKVSTPIVMRTRLGDMDLKGAPKQPREGAIFRLGRGVGRIWRRATPWNRTTEYDIVTDIYTRNANLNGRDSLHEYSVMVALTHATLDRLIGESLSPAARPVPSPADKEARDKIVKEVIDTVGIEYLLDEPPPQDPDDPIVQKAKLSAKRHIEFVFQDSDLAEAKAELVRAEVQAVCARAAAAVVRHRMVNATTGWLTCLSLLVVPAAIIAALVLANTSQSEDEAIRERLAVQKQCTEIAATISEKNLPFKQPDCSELEETEPKPEAADPAVLEDRADTIAATVEAYLKCTTASPRSGDCETIKKMVEAALGSP